MKWPITSPCQGENRRFESGRARKLPLKSSARKEVEKLNKIKINESVVSMILGAVVVVLAGLLAYNYFRGQNISQQVTGTDEGELTAPAATMALPTTHTVIAGETLWSIAEKYFSDGYSYLKVAQANNLENPSVIEPGQKLIIPGVKTQSAITENSYTVASGDSLWQIAVRAYGDGYRWTDIAKANNLISPSLIHAGNVLIFPKP